MVYVVVGKQRLKLIKFRSKNMATVRGRLIDAETKEPIFASAVELRTLNWDLVQATPTDVDGQFVFRNVSPGTYYLIGKSVIHTPVKAEIRVEEPGGEWEIRAAKAILI